MKIFMRLLKLLTPYWKLMILAALLGALTVGSNVGLLAVSAVLIASAALQPPILDLLTLIVGVRFFGIARAVIRYLERYLSHDVTFRILSRIRTWFYGKVEPIAPGGLRGYSSGDLLSRIVNDVDTLKYFFLRVLAAPLIAILVLIGVVIFLAWFNMKVALVFFGLFSMAAILVPLFIARISRGVGKEIVQTKAQLNNILLDTVGGMTDIVAYGREKVQGERVGQLGERLEKLQIKGTSIMGLSSALINLGMNLTLWTILLIAIPLVSDQKLDGIYLAMLALGAMAAFEAAIPLTLVAQNFEESLQAARRLFQLADQTVPSEEGAEEIYIHSSYDIKGEKVFFHYDEERWILKGLDFYVPPRGKVAIVGPSGVGKSTLINLFLRFWDYQEGLLTVNGQEIKKASPYQLRRLMGVLTQNTYIFNGTIRENILMARTDANEEELISATKKARLYQFIAGLPQGFDTYVGMNGMKLSGGQRQRLAIARVILKDAPILILDEPTNGLDSITEGEIMKDLYHLMEDRTSLIITHRLHHLEGMDKILVMDQGRIVEEGTHRELLAMEGLYYQMWMLSRYNITT